jgi:3-oxoacyl-(acyl-carrier-protein) synthase
VIGILGLGLVTPLGHDPVEVLRLLRAGASGLREHGPLRALPDSRAGVVDGPDLTGFLTRKKDARLLARAARLALPAAGRALAGFIGDREDMGIFVAVGREPPDEGEAEPALAAMATADGIDRAALAGAGRGLYPPLLPLRTLPNMVLAHVSIQHAIRGENGTFAGGAEAGRQALAAGLAALGEGRAQVALVGAAWSGVDLGSARDRLRAGATDPPGEAAMFVLLGEGGVPLTTEPLPTRAAFGDTGPVEGFLSLLASVVP